MPVHLKICSHLIFKVSKDAKNAGSGETTAFPIIDKLDKIVKSSEIKLPNVAIEFPISKLPLFVLSWIELAKNNPLLSMRISFSFTHNFICFWSVKLTEKLISLSGEIKDISPVS